MIRRFGPRPDPACRHRPRPGAYAILQHGGQVLLTRQDGPVPELQLPGGGIDPGESALRALHREVFEETGWGLTAARRIDVFRRFCYMPDHDLMAEKVCAVFVARPTRRIAAPRDPGHAACWLALEAALARLANAGERHFLRRAAR